jgi:hypothetical protein
MAFYCLDCVNKLCNRTYDAKELVFSECLYICEGCGEYKTVVLMTKQYYWRRKLCLLIRIFRIITLPVYILWRLLILPYLIVKNPPPFIKKQQNDGEE